MIKVLAAALAGTMAGIVVMIAVIALSGTDTQGASTEGLELPTATQPSGETVGGTEPSTGGPDTGGGTTGGGTTGGTAGGGTTGGGTTGGGDPANGEQLFAANCQSCHANEPGAESTFPGAPNLAEGSLDEQTILTQIDQGGNGMPPDLVQGQDAQDVAAYVVSIQGG
jgi:mono/diheme cytochrome c family protein